MHPLNAVLLGLVVAWAVKRRNGVDPLGRWRWAAALAGSLFPYIEIAFLLVGPGAYAQAYHGITWSVVLLPFYAFMLAGLVGGISGRGWGAVLAPVSGGLVAAWLLGVLTEQGVFPFAMLADFRVGLGILNGFDFILLGLCVLGMAMVLIFPIFDRDLARLSVMCVLGYVLMCAYWGWQADRFGHAYAEALGMKDARVHALPQPLSPLNWRVIVEEPNGRLHDTLIHLTRTKDKKVTGDMGMVARMDALYKPRDRAVWRIYRRYGGPEVGDEGQRRIRRAWFAWQDSAFGWYGRFAVFDRLYTVPAAVGGVNLGCIGFKDLRFEGAQREERGKFVVCPARDGGARIFQPVEDAKGEVTGVRELIPLMKGV